MADDQSLSQLGIAKPVHMQRLERSLRLEPFLDQVQEVLRRYLQLFDTIRLFFMSFWLSRDEDEETSDSSDSFHDPAMNITEDVQLLHGLPVSKSG